MGDFRENMLKIWALYQNDVSADPADLRDVAKWAIDKKLWAPRPVDITASFAREMADVLREQVRKDEDGRQYRAFIPARTKDKDGLPLFKWGDISTSLLEAMSRKESKESDDPSRMTASL